MSLTATAEQDWAAFYLLQRGAALGSASCSPQHFGNPQIAGWYRTAQRVGEWVRSEELGIDVDAGLRLTSRLVLQREIPEIERRIVQGWALRHARTAAAAFLDSTRGDTPADFETAAQGLLCALTEAQSGLPVDSVTHGDAARTAISTWLGAAQAPEPRAIPLPWPRLHSHTHGLPRKKLVLIGGRSSEHKTTFARSCAAHAAEKGFRVLYWTLEDNIADIAGRTIVDATGFPTTTALATGGWPGNKRPDRILLETGLAKIGAHIETSGCARNLRYIDRSNPTRSQVIATIRAEAARGLDMFVGDFVQLTQPDDPRERITDSWWRSTCAMFSAVAQELDIAMLWVSQIEKTGTRESKDANRLPKAVEMPYGAQLFQGAYGVIMVGFEGKAFRCRIEKWKSAAAAGKLLNLHIEPQWDRIVEL